MGTVTCPYCYHRAHSSQLHFQCTGRGSPGKSPCTPREDAERRNRTGYASPAMPTFPAAERTNRGRRAWCPDDGSETSFRACPACHTPLLASLVDSPSPLIGMIGGTGSGKTVYLTVLSHQLTNVIRKQFDADVHLVGDQQAGTDSIQAWLQNYEDALFKDHRLFEPTPPALNGRRVPLVLEWRQPRRRFGRLAYSTTILSFCDAAGEDLISQENAHRQAYLAAADGLIVLLDGWQLPGVADQIEVPRAERTAQSLINVLTTITNVLRAEYTISSRARIQVPLAVVVSKFDAIEPLLPNGHFLTRSQPSTGAGYDEEFGVNAHEHVRSLLHDLKADDLDIHLRSSYQNFRYFALSSLGARPDYDQRKVDPRGVQPMHVAEPLLWLMNQKHIIGRVPHA